MARVGRLAGALLVDTTVSGERAYFLVGNTKGPCDFAASGFASPGEIDAMKRPFLRLVVTEGATEPTLGKVVMAFDGEGDELARGLAARLVIARNGSVSERLWSLLVESATGEKIDGAYDVRWLGRMPEAVWEIVRDAVLKCS